MLDDPVERSKAAKGIAREAMRGEEGDPFAELDALDVKFFRQYRVNLSIPIVDPTVSRQCLMFLINELPGLIAEMDRVKEPRSKSLLVHTRLQRWNQAFARKIKR